MSEAIQELQNIGAQKIHNDTHISKHHAQAILHETFDGLTKLQVNGFISILEREYEIDLSELRKSSDAYFSDISSNVNKNIFVNDEVKKSNTLIYIFSAIIIVSIFAFFISSFSNSIKTISIPNEKDIVKIVEEKIVSEKKKIKVIDINNSDINNTEKNVTVVSEKSENNRTMEKIVVEEKKIIKSFEIVPKRKVWIGRFNLDTHKKRQGTVRNKLILEPKNNYLLVLGHSYIDILLNSKPFNFKNSGTLRLKYIDGKLSIIKNKEFKKLSKGLVKW